MCARRAPRRSRRRSRAADSIACAHRANAGAPRPRQALGDAGACLASALGGVGLTLLGIRRRQGSWSSSLGPRRARIVRVGGRRELDQPGSSTSPTPPNLAQRCLAVGDLDGAVWAARRGLDASQTHRRLTKLLISGPLCQGDIRAADRLLESHQAAMERLKLDDVDGALVQYYPRCPANGKARWQADRRLLATSRTTPVRTLPPPQLPPEGQRMRCRRLFPRGPSSKDVGQAGAMPPVDPRECLRQGR